MTAPSLTAHLAQTSAELDTAYVRHLCWLLMDVQLFIDRDHPDADAANDPAYRDAVRAWADVSEARQYLASRLPD